MSVLETIEGIEGFPHPAERNGSLEADICLDDFLNRAGIEVADFQKTAIIDYKNLNILLPTTLWVSEGSVFMVTIGTGDETNGYEAVYLRKHNGEFLRRTAKCSKSTFSVGGYGNYVAFNDNEDLMRLTVALVGEGPVEVASEPETAARIRELFPETMQEKVRRVSRGLIRLGRA